MLKTFVPTLIALVKHLCLYIIRHDQKLRTIISTTITDSVTRDRILFWLTETQAVCGLLQFFFPE